MNSGFKKTLLSLAMLSALCGCNFEQLERKEIVEIDRSNSVVCSVLAEKKFYAEALSFCKQAVAQDPTDSTASLFLGKMYLEGDLVKQNISMGLDYLQHSVELNNAKAVTLLAKVYLDGKYVKKDSAKAIKLLEDDLVNNPNHVESVSLLAELYDEGVLVAKDANKGIELMQKASDAGNLEATIALAEFLYFAQNEHKDQAKAIALLTRLADEGNFKAALILSRLKIDLQKGSSKEDIAIAEKYLAGIFQASEIDLEKEDLELAYSLLSHIYEGAYDNSQSDINKLMKLSERGLELQLGGAYLDKATELLNNKLASEEDNKQAVAYLEKAAKRNNGYAHLILAKLYGRGLHGALERNPEQLLRHIFSAADAGLLEAKYVLANSYSDGVYVNKDINFAVKKHSELVMQNHYVPSIIFLSNLLTSGEYMQKDYASAVKILQIGVKEKRDPECEAMLAKIYLDKNSGFTDMEKGRELLKDAINQKSVKAKYLLALSYLPENTDEPDPKLAVELLKEVVDEGFYDGINALGLLYTRGVGVEKSYKKAKSLYQKSLDMGIKNSVKYLFDLSVLEKNYKEAYAWGKTLESCNLDMKKNMTSILKGLGKLSKKDKQELDAKSKELISSYGCSTKN